MRKLNVPAVEDPARFFPEPRMVRPPRTERLEDGYGRFFREDRNEWERVHPICLDIIARLEQRLPWQELLDTLPAYPSENIHRKTAERLARRYVWKLHKLGHVRIDLEPPPAIFNGRYEHVRELGRGGLGVAHLCHDRDDHGRDVVVKHPWGVKQDISKGQKALAVEIHLQDTLRHPSIPRLVDSFSVRGLLHLVRDFVDGKKLGSAAGALRHDRDRRVRLAVEVATALHYIHREGYLFFDPSPDNFFLTADDHVMLTDLGGAKPHSDGTVRVTGARGTPGYVAPELRKATKSRPQTASVPSDAWAFGCLYYALTMGRRPRRLWNETEIRDALVAASIDPRDIQIITSCCRDDRNARPHDFGTILDLLRETP